MIRQPQANRIVTTG